MRTRPGAAAMNAQCVNVAAKDKDGVQNYFRIRDVRGLSTVCNLVVLTDVTRPPH